MPTPYNHHWRTVLRPETLRRDGYECVKCGVGDRAAGLRSALEVAHLDGDSSNNAPENRAALCNTCHKAHDYPTWWPQYRAWLKAKQEREIDEADAARPILQLLKEAV
jgi:5-methylcytosine-specific restriction endonuclease McrA